MTRRTSRAARAATVVPLALISAAWTTHLAGTAPAITGTAADGPAVRPLPDGTRVPRAPLDYPASLSRPDTVLAAGDRRFAAVAVRPSAGDIPSSALAAYQRAESVINAADPTCGLRWQLIAAIGRVESDHGRFGGSTLDPAGVVSPAITGPVLDGRNGTARIQDTDGGQYDGDTRFDRAVGPMQFIPSTWAVVGVDADNDGVRNPQDVDDAALATAVYLCSGDDDLSGPAGQRPAVYRYNHSNSYVELVLAITRSYLDGDFGTVPTPVLSAGALVPPTGADPLVPQRGGPALDTLPAGVITTVSADPQPALDPVVLGPPTDPEPTDPEPTDPEQPAEPTEPTGPAEEPTDPAEEPTDPAEEPTDPAEEPTDPAEEPTDPAEPADPSDPVEDPSDPAEPVDPAEPEPGTLSPEDAAQYCADEGQVDAPADDLDPYDLCVLELTAPEPDPESPESPEAPLSDEATTGRE